MDIPKYQPLSNETLTFQAHSEMGQYETFLYHAERNHQGKGNVLLFPTAAQAKTRVDGSVACKERLGGLLKYYHRDAA